MGLTCPQKKKKATRISGLDTSKLLALDEENSEEPKKEEEEDEFYKKLEENEQKRGKLLFQDMKFFLCREVSSQEV